jgi:uncharacterized membrane protein
MPMSKAVEKDQHRFHAVKNAAIARQEVGKMLWTIAVILLVLWALGLVTSYTMGGFIHVLLVIAIVVVLINVIQGRKVL